MEAETYLTPDKALEYGLIDEVYGKKGEAPKPEEIFEKLSQMQRQLNSQQSFREQIAELRDRQPGGLTGGTQNPQENGLLQLFKGMAQKGE